jgi:hypothetical protein
MIISKNIWDRIKNLFSNKITVKGSTNDGSTNVLELYDSDDVLVNMIKSNGSQRTPALSSAWKDMIADLFGKRLYATAGTVDYDYDENVIIFQANGDITSADDRVGGNQEINHEFLIGTNITFRPHIHWWQQVTSGAVVAYVFTLRWRLQRNGQAKATSWNTITCNVGAGGDDVYDFTSEADGLYNQISRFDDITITCGLSDTIQFQMTRSDANAANVGVTFFDLHGQVDSNGSDSEISKT